MRWQGMPEFIAAAQAQSFTAAAQQIGTSVAHISRSVSALEEYYNTQLFIRSTRKVVLTQQGELLLHHAKKAQSVLEQGEWALQQQQAQPSGQLKITAPVMFGEQFIMPLVHEYMARYPKVSVTMVLSNQTMDLIGEHIDLAIRIGELADSNLRARRLASRAVVVCASPDYLNEYGQPYALSELAHHQCLLGHSDSWRFQEGARLRHVKIAKTKLRCNSGWALADAAVRGLGLVQLPDYYVQSALHQGLLKEVLHSFAIHKEPISAITPANLYQANATKALMDYLAEHLSDKLGAINTLGLRR
ncbi:LysR substrate-binding domain-containing protein [Pseudoalteromonas sp. T1lg48]|uniref:LysR substrate-binding domain-containing protein n=1 Tax=Pseudoalteromonas sp. T1lg48 TaxID=2077100 RepID=UPI001F2CA650|nr:LysR substrate-binding domain-containing protein [Pseudoalteromonas sp. T1lg48]